MSNYIKYFWGLLLCFCFIDVVDAEICSKDEIARLKTIANEIEVNYEYVEEDGAMTDLYNIYFNGQLSDVYIVVDDYKSYASTDGKELVIQEYASDLQIEVYSEKCDELIKKISLNLPSYNTYSLSEECEALKEYDLDVCDEWYIGQINDEIFYDTVSQYYESNPDDTEEYLLDYNIEYIIREFWMVILGGVIILTIIILLIIRYRKRRVLE